MAQTFHPNGLLDVSKLRERDYAPLPADLARYKPATNKEDAAPLFARPPKLSDIDSLLRVHAVDDSLHACFASLLSGLSSGPAVIMGAFFAQEDQTVVLRMHAPARPKPFGSLPPIYFCVPRSHAQLAVQKQWVTAQAPLWLALYAAVYYSLIGKPADFYRRRDLGGPDNAAWLVFYGKDSARAEDADSSDESSDSRNGKKAGTSADPGQTKALRAKVLAVGSEGTDALDERFLAEQVFVATAQPGKAVPTKRAKLWIDLLKKQAPNKDATLSKLLASDDRIPEHALRAWLRAHKSLPADAADAADVVDSILLFLELNGAINGQGRERYSAGARSLWKEVRSLVGSGVPVVLELDADDRLAEALKHTPLDSGTIAVSVVDATAVDVIEKDGKRRLRFFGLAAKPGSGRIVRVAQPSSWWTLCRTPSRKHPYPVDVEQLFVRAVRLHVGSKGQALLASSKDVPSFSLDLPRRAGGKLTWPR